MFHKHTKPHIAGPYTYHLNRTGIVSDIAGCFDLPAGASIQISIKLFLVGCFPDGCAGFRRLPTAQSRYRIQLRQAPFVPIRDVGYHALSQGIVRGGIGGLGKMQRPTPNPAFAAGRLNGLLLGYLCMISSLSE
jgi:hypothetical protein